MRMGRPFGSRNRVYRVAQRDRRRIVDAVQRTRVARGFANESADGPDAETAGYSDRHARRVLWRSMQRVAAMSDDERERLKRLPPPPAEGTQMRRAVELRASGMPYRDIAEELGIDPSRAIHYVVEGLERFLGEEARCADTARRIHLERLDRV